MFRFSETLVLCKVLSDVNAKFETGSLVRMQDARPNRYEFGEFLADISTGELYRHGERVPIQEKPFQFLAVLLESNGAVVTREELSRKMWPDTHVQVDQGLNAAARKVRLALGDEAGSPRFIETLGSRGYRFIVECVAKYEEPERVEQVRIAVLPFENESALANVVSSGIAAELISQLGRFKELHPIAPASSEQFGAVSMDSIRRDLGVDYVVKGRIGGDGGVLTLSAEVVSVDDSRTLWAETFDKRADELSSLQGVIATRIANAILQRRDEPPGPGRTIPFSAYESYMRGRHFWNKRNPPALQKSIEYFEQSIAQDPGYALAHAGLADSYNMLATHGAMLPKIGYAKAKECATRALHLQTNLAQALVPLAWAQLSLDYDYEAARKGFERAIGNNPSYAFAFNGYSYLLMASGDIYGGIAAMKRGRDLDPLSLPMNSLLSNCYFYARDYEAALRQAELAIELDAQFPVAHACAGLAHWGLGQMPQAVRAFEKAVMYSMQAPIMIAHLAYALALTGHEERAREIAQDLAEASEPAVAPAYHIALIYAALRQHDVALEWIERACEERFHWTLYLKSDPRVDVLRSDPRFPSICPAIGVPR